MELSISSGSRADTIGYSDFFWVNHCIDSGAVAPDIKESDKIYQNQDLPPFKIKYVVNTSVIVTLLKNKVYC